jgi:hypothetical protein
MRHFVTSASQLYVAMTPVKGLEAYLESKAILGYGEEESA